MTRKDLSNLSNVSIECIYNVETGVTKTLNIKTANKITKILNISNCFLLYGIKNLSNNINKVKFYRVNSGLSQKDLSLITGLNESTINDYENDKLNNKDTLNLILKQIED